MFSSARTEGLEAGPFHCPFRRHSDSLRQWQSFREPAKLSHKSDTFEGSANLPQIPR